MYVFHQAGAESVADLDEVVSKERLENSISSAGKRHSAET